MDTELKEKWVAALRSGNYRKGIGALRDTDNNFCCLGVLCDVFDPGGWMQEKIPADAIRYQFKEYDLVEEFGLPQQFMDKIGITGGAQDKLILMNDSGMNPVTFSQIADWIEDNL